MRSKTTLAASVIMLAALSSAAVAGTTNTPPRWSEAASSTQAMDRFNAYDWVAPAAEPDVHRYHGGPKVND